MQSESRREFGDGIGRLVLGTAQLGMSYGIANKVGRPDEAAAVRIVEAAWNCGIREFDTAQAYGESERALGGALGSLGISAECGVITKYRPGTDYGKAGELKRSVLESLERLGVERLKAVMLHREDDLDALDDRASKELEALVAAGLVEGIGVSVYSPRRAMEALENDIISLVQLPANVLDRRFERAGVFETASTRKKRVYIRSVYLQGLLLMEPDSVPERAERAVPYVERFKEAAAAIGMERKDVALGYIKNLYPDASIVVGAETPEQVVENCRSWSSRLDSDHLAALSEISEGIEEAVIDPSTWR